MDICFRSDGASAAAASGPSANDMLAEIYTGPKAALRPIHDAFMAEIGKFSEFEIAPKKGYVSLRNSTPSDLISHFIMAIIAS